MEQGAVRRRLGRADLADGIRRRRSPTFQAIYLEELARANAPDHLGVIGLNMAGPTILAWGNDEQKKRLLPPLLAAEEVWWGLLRARQRLRSGGRTNRRRCGRRLVMVNGQKAWSSYAHIADWCILVVRTDMEAAKHAGLSVLLVDMHLPGDRCDHRVRSLVMPSSTRSSSPTSVPVGSMLGSPGDGWRVAMTTLLHERGTLGFALTAALERLVAGLVPVREEAPDGPVLQTIRS